MIRLETWAALNFLGQIGVHHLVAYYMPVLKEGLEMLLIPLSFMHRMEETTFWFVAVIDFPNSDTSFSYVAVVDCQAATLILPSHL